MEFSALGDSALLIRVESDFENVPRKTLETVLQTVERLEAADIPGVIDIAPAYTSVAVFFDLVELVKGGAPPEDVFGWLAARIGNLLRQPPKRKSQKAATRVMEIPVCYEDEFAPDLDEVAQRASVNSSEVIRLHVAAEYCVHCVGFTPGFAYLGGLDPRLATPRRETPRTQVPAGAVAIGGMQTGVYPLSSPGGWNIIGRTPLRMFDVKRQPPSLLQTGDRVRFRSITRAEFDSLGE